MWAFNKHLSCPPSPDYYLCSVEMAILDCSAPAASPQSLCLENRISHHHLPFGTGRRLPSKGGTILSQAVANSPACPTQYHQSARAALVINTSISPIRVLSILWGGISLWKRSGYQSLPLVLFYKITHGAMIKKKKSLVFVPGFWHRALKIPWNSSVIRKVVAMLTRWFKAGPWESFRMGTGHQKD